MKGLSRIAGLFCLFLFCTGISECPEGEVVYRGAQLTGVDMHLHTGTWNGMTPEMQDTLRETLPGFLRPFASIVADRTLSAEGIAGQLREAGLSRGGLFAVYAPDTIGVTTNALVLSRVQERPDVFYGFASISADEWLADQEAELAELESYLALDEFIGVKMAHPHMLLALNDERFYSIYEAAARHGTPVYVHTGTTPAPGAKLDAAATDPASLEEAIAAYSDTIFILGHLGFDFIDKSFEGLETCLRLAEQYDNVYLEASALGSASSDPDGEILAGALTAIRDRGFVDRLLYGSDGPQRPGFVKDYLTRTLTAMDAADFTVEEAQMVLADNFSRLFGVSL